MPKRDTYHEFVKSALIKDGWSITHDPLILAFGRRNVFIDFGGEQAIGAEKLGRKIAVEVKSFLGVSEVADLEQALGQFALYRFLLERHEPERQLYLAVTQKTYQAIFAEAEGRDLVTFMDLKLIIFEPTIETNLRWTTQAQ